jgi:hypothetical protein
MMRVSYVANKVDRRFLHQHLSTCGLLVMEGVALKKEG